MKVPPEGVPTYLKVHDLIAGPGPSNGHDDLSQQNNDKGRHRKDLPAVLRHGLQASALLMLKVDSEVVAASCHCPGHPGLHRRLECALHATPR